MTTTQPTRIGKSTVATCVGLSFAQVRQDDRVVAIHADTAFDTLGARVGAALLDDLAIQLLVGEGARLIEDREVFLGPVDTDGRPRRTRRAL